MFGTKCELKPASFPIPHPPPLSPWLFPRSGINRDACKGPVWKYSNNYYILYFFFFSSSSFRPMACYSSASLHLFNGRPRLLFSSGIPSWTFLTSRSSAILDMRMLHSVLLLCTHDFMFWIPHVSRILSFISYILYWGRKKNSHGLWWRRCSRLLAVFLLLHISPAATDLRRSAATEDCYVIITTNVYVNTKVQNREVCWKVTSNVSRGTHRGSFWKTSVCPLSTNLAPVSVSYQGLSVDLPWIYAYQSTEG